MLFIWILVIIIKNINYLSNINHNMQNITIMTLSLNHPHDLQNITIMTLTLINHSPDFDYAKYYNNILYST